MRIAILSHAGMPFGFELGLAFQRLGAEVVFFSLDGQEPRREGLEVRYLAPRGMLPHTMSRVWAYARQLRKARAELRRYDADVLFAMFLTSGGFIGSLCPRRAFVASALGTDVERNVDSWRGRCILRRTTRKADLVHAVSERLAERLHGRVGVPREKILVAPVGIDTEQVRFVSMEQRPGDGRLISTRGHLPVYDHGTLVDAIEMLRDRGVQCRLTFASARQSWRTKEIVAGRDLDDRVTFLDGFDSSRLTDLLGNADVYVSSSLSDGTSNSLLEALSNGLFPVVSDIPANRPWVSHGENGLLFRPGDAGDCAEQLAAALRDESLRGRAASVNRSLACERGDVNRQAERHLEAFERLLRPRAGGGPGAA